MNQKDTNEDAAEALTTQDHRSHSLGKRILRALAGVPDSKKGALAAEAERLQSHVERLYHQVRRVRAVIDSPRTMGARNASVPDGEIELLVFVKDVREALDGPAPEPGTPAGTGGAPTTNGSILFFDLVQTEAHLVNDVWLWADGGTVSERELVEEDWIVVRDAGKEASPPVPGQLRWKFDGGRGAMIDENDRIVGYYNPPAVER